MLLHLNPSSGVPVYLQLEAQVKQAVAAGGVAHGRGAAFYTKAGGGAGASIRTLGAGLTRTWNAMA